MPRTLGRTKDHREALLRNLSRSLVLHESLTTTRAKAKDVARVFDQWMTLARQTASNAGSDRLAPYRRLLSLVHDQVVVKKLVNDLATRSVSRTSGFTRSVNLPARVGDAADQMRLWLTDPKVVKPAPKAKKATPLRLTATKGQAPLRPQATKGQA